MTYKLFSLLSLALLMGLALQQSAQAGPPLICHPYEIGNARSLPWNGTEWRDVKADYPLNRLVDDTLALLTSDAPVIVRMETMRRAAIYAVWARHDKEVRYNVNDLKIAHALLARLMERVEAAQRSGKSDALALFDAGYFIETWKNATAREDHAKLPQVNGYDMVKKASGLRGTDAAMEFAAALMNFTDKAVQRAHLQKAVAGAEVNSLLARNLVRHFGDRGRDIATLRASVGLAKQ